MFVFILRNLMESNLFKLYAGQRSSKSNGYIVAEIVSPCGGLSAARGEKQ